MCIIRLTDVIPFINAIVSFINRIKQYRAYRLILEQVSGRKSWKVLEQNGKQKWIEREQIRFPFRGATPYIIYSPFCVEFSKFFYKFFHQNRPL